jgi:muramoyltetrapeptide carboxypeptidase LdcA involved in peptidoglycan recycling
MTDSAPFQLLRPRALKPGDLVVIASLSGPLPAAYESHIEKTVVVLEQMGFRVRCPASVGTGRMRRRRAERSYLQVMRHNGILDRISGMVVGVPRDIGGLDSPEASPTLSEIVLDVLGDRDIPVLGNVDLGHAGPNLPMPVGTRVGLDAQQLTLSLLEPAVRAHTATAPGIRQRSGWIGSAGADT